MPIRFACPHCRADYTIHERAAGTEVGCAACGRRLFVPAAQPPSADPPVAAPVVVYIPPAGEVADYRTPRRQPPREEPVHVREEVHFVHQQRGAFTSAFGRTLGEGCGCITLVFIVLGMALAALIFLKAGSSQPPRRQSDQSVHVHWAPGIAARDRPAPGPCFAGRAGSRWPRAGRGGVEPEALTDRAGQSDVLREPLDRVSIARPRPC
jgi:hypothetical protein